MGFCGCTLYTSTILAGILGIILSIYGVTWTGYVLAFFRGDVPTSNLTNPFELISYGNSTNCIVVDIITTSLVIHVLWFITSALLIPGNKKCIQSLLLIWVTVTTVIVVTDASGMGYFIYKAVDKLPHYENTTQLVESMNNTAFLPFIIIAALFSKLGTILLFVLISLTVFVWQRVEEMKEQKNFYMRNHRYSYSSTESIPSHRADQHRVIYSSRELLPAAYTTQSLDNKGRTNSSSYNRHRIPPVVQPQRSDSLKPNYGLDNFGFAIPHLPRGHSRGFTGRVAEPEIDYDDYKVSSYTSKDYRY